MLLPKGYREVDVIRKIGAEIVNLELLHGSNCRSVPDRNGLYHVVLS